MRECIKYSSLHVGLIIHRRSEEQRTAEERESGTDQKMRGSVRESASAGGASPAFKGN